MPLAMGLIRGGEFGWRLRLETGVSTALGELEMDIPYGPESLRLRPQLHDGACQRYKCSIQFEVEASPSIYRKVFREWYVLG